MTLLVQGIILLCVGLIGMLGNLAAIPYLGIRISRQRTFYTLLISLSICDLVVVVTGMLLYGFPKISDEYANKMYLIIAPYVFPIFEIGSTGGIYFTMAICIERYFVVCRPFWYREKAISSNMYTIPIICFSIAYNIPRFFEVRTVEQNHDGITMDMIKLNQSLKNLSGVAQTLRNTSNFSTYIIEPTAIRKNVVYYGVYHIGCAIIFQFIAPLIVLILANIMILKQLIKYNHESPPISNKDGSHRMKNTNFLRPLIENRLNNSITNETSFHSTTAINQQSVEQKRKRNQIDRTKITLAICGIFTFCHLFKWVLNIYELYIRFSSQNLSEEKTNERINESDWFGTVVNISNTLVVLNSSINFYVYVLKVCWMTR